MLNTPFSMLHVAAGAKMTPFSGYNMPLHYGSQIAEHEAVRQDAGVFDVSHMMITDVSGPDAKVFFQKLLANDVAKLEKVGFGKALYSPMLNESAGVVDDVIVYWMPFGYRIVSNAGTRAKVQAWFAKVALQFQVNLKERTDFAMLAIQGPQAISKVCMMRPQWQDRILALKLFQGVECDGFFVARTGYTGEEGLEVMIPVSEVNAFWQDLLKVGAIPCGLAARDTLRLEAGMNLYGQDMDENVHPLEAGLAWCIDLKDNQRNFIGRSGVEAKMNTPYPKQVGLLLLGKGVLRGHQVFRNHLGEMGELTSGTFSPTLKQSIAMARVPAHTGETGQVEIRGEWQEVRVLPLPFVRNGQKCFE
jgi:aminomethyltransferase